MEVDSSVEEMTCGIAIVASPPGSGRSAKEVRAGMATKKRWMYVAEAINQKRSEIVSVNSSRDRITDTSDGLFQGNINNLWSNFPRAAITPSPFINVNILT